MSDVVIATRQAASWALSHAVLIYESALSSSVYATVHDIEDGRSKNPRIGNGVPATKEACAGIARALGAAATLSGFVPPNMIYLGARSILWWRPPAPARVFFDTSKSAAADQPQDKTQASVIGKRNGVTPQPGLVFGVSGGKWFVYAVDGADRPGPGTRLLRSPYFNVWANGEICTGNVRLPDTLSVSTLEVYERAFFDSQFTHPNLRGKERLTKHPEGSYMLWRRLLDAPAPSTFTAFPVEHLIDAKLTVQDLAKRLDKEEGR